MANFYVEDSSQGMFQGWSKVTRVSSTQNVDLKMLAMFADYSTVNQK